MARRRRIMEPPLHHLQRAADAHARLTAGEETPPEGEPEETPAEEPTSHERHARGAARNQEGKFA